MNDITSKINIFKISPSGLCFAKTGALTIGYEISYPAVKSMDESDFSQVDGEQGFDLISIMSMAIQQLGDDYVFHQQDIFTPRKIQTPNTDDYLSSSAERMWQNNEMPVFVLKTYIFISKRFSSFTESTKEDTINDFVENCNSFYSIIKTKKILSILTLDREKYFNYIDSVLKFNFEKTSNEFIDVGKMSVGDKNIHSFSILGDSNIKSLASCSKNGDSSVLKKFSIYKSWLHDITWGINCTKIVNNVIKTTSKDSIKKIVKTYEKHLAVISKIFSNHVEACEDYVECIDDFTPVYHHYNISYLIDKENEKSLVNRIEAGFNLLGLYPTKITDFENEYLSMFGGTAQNLNYPSSLYPSFLDEALCFNNYESEYYQSANGILVGDVNGNPLYLDLDNKPYDDKIITNWNNLIVGSSGTGKSVLTNKMIASLLPSGDYFFFIIDIGSSYKALSMIHKDISTYIELDRNSTTSISFNPFLLPLKEGTSVEIQDEIKVLMEILFIAWDYENNLPNINVNTKSIVRDILTSFYNNRYQNDTEFVCFNDIYEYVIELNKIKSEILQLGKDYFDVTSFLLVLKDYYIGGTYDKLFNSKENVMSIKNKSLIVFEMENIKNDQKLMNIIISLLVQMSKSILSPEVRFKHKRIILDEAWSFIADNRMAVVIDELYKTIRKKGGGVGIMLQNLGNLFESKYAPTIIKNSGTQIYLSHIDSKNDIQEYKTRLELTDKNLKLICTPKLSDYAFIVKQGSSSTSALIYRNIVSQSELVCYSSSANEKIELLESIDHHKGNIKNAIADIVQKRFNK